eukprot:symbB.v1.2.009953.t1/scaffold559.1/size321893/8
MSRLLHRKPRTVTSMAKHVLKYLHRTKDFALWYTPCKAEDWGENNVLHLHRSMHRLEVYCDSSFGLEHEGGRSVQGTLIEWAGSPIQWSSSRQPLVAASTGEAELLGYSEGHQQGLSIGAILNTLEIKPTYVLYGECKSALSLASTDSGPWRTRHLRLRAHKLREALRLHSPDPTQEPEWSARHLSGIDLVADGMTKPLLGASFLRFAKRLSLHGSWLNNLEDGATCLKKCNPSNPPFVDDADEGVGRQLVALGSLLIRGFSAVVAKCGHLLIAAGAIMIDRFENENLDVQRGETNNHDGPRLCAFRAQGPHDQAPVRPSRRPVEPQASRRGYAACPMEHSETPSQSMQSDQEFEGTSMGIMLLYNILLVGRIAGWSLKTAGWHDTWTSMDLWTKDFLWKGYTIFELKNNLAEKETDSKQEPVGASSMPGSQQSVHVESGILETSYGFVGVAQAPPMMYAPTSYLRDPTSSTVTVNVNVAGGATASSSSVPQRQTEFQSPSSVDSEFEMVDED